MQLFYCKKCLEMILFEAGGSEIGPGRSGVLF